MFEGPEDYLYGEESEQSAALAERYGAHRIIALGLGAVASAFALLTTLTADTPLLVIAAGLALFGAGMGITGAPATGEIMSSVPLAKAGVGSAVNDTTRELGGALGIALLGSIANSSYRSNIDLGGLELSPDVAAAAGESIGAASSIAQSVPDGASIVAHANTAFADAFSVANGVSAGITVVAEGLMLMWHRRRDDTPDLDDCVEPTELSQTKEQSRLHW